MFAITGVTGHVGGAAARALLDANQPVRAVVRDPRRLGLDTPGSKVSDAATAGNAAARNAVTGDDAAWLDEAGLDEAANNAARIDAAGNDTAWQHAVSSSVTVLDAASNNGAGLGEAGNDAAGNDAAGFDEVGEDAAGFDEVAVADFSDRAALTAALQGCAGAFVLLPTIPSGDDAAHREMAGTIAGAVADSGVPHVVALSSYGAELAEGNGPIRWLHHFENLLRVTGVRVTVIRSPHFQEKVEEVLAPARDAGIYPVFGDSADVPAPMVATRDIGAAVAEALVNSSPSQQDVNTSVHEDVNTTMHEDGNTTVHEGVDAVAGDGGAGFTVVDLEAPEYTERQVAEALGAALGRRLEVVIVPREAWILTWTDAGMDPGLAAELVELYEATEQGRLVPKGDRSRRCTTEIDETLSALIA